MLPVSFNKKVKCYTIQSHTIQLHTTNYFPHNIDTIISIQLYRLNAGEHLLQFYRYAYIDIMLSITSLAHDAGQGSAICNQIYIHTHNHICAILHIVSTDEIQCADFCKIKQPNLQNSATTRSETSHLKSRDPD